MLSLKFLERIKIVWCIRISLLLPLFYYLFSLLPVGDGSTVCDIALPPGSGIKKLASELKQHKIIRSSWQFTIMTRLRGDARRLKSGEYRFNDAMSANFILSKVVNGDVDVCHFSLPEGYSIYQCAELLEQKGFFKRDEFLEACRDKRVLQKFHINADSLEGYLFPATYSIGRTETAIQFVTKMVEQFIKEYADVELLENSANLNRHEVVTLASIIEKEAIESSEKATISSVFHNRLRIGMPLQSDPTAVYGVRAFIGKVTKKDIEKRSDYNTYQIKGLPPGPIGNPGVDALKSVLKPKTTSYLYFVARQDGTHQFSKNLEEHNRAVTRFLR